MTSRARSLLSAFALLAVAAGAVAFAWFGVARKDEAVAARKAAGQRLFAFEPAQVKALTLRAKGTTTALARAGDGWRLEGERPAPAQRRVVEGLLEAVAGLQKKAVLSPADGPALEQYGLAAPEAQLTLTLDGGRQVELALGGENAYDGTRFVRTGDGTVALVDGGVAWRLTRDRQAFEQPPPPPPSPDAGVDAGRPPP